MYDCTDLKLDDKAVFFIFTLFQYQTGWRFKKRPGVDYFLSQIGPPEFEVVIYSQAQGMVCLLMIEKMYDR